MPKTWESRIVGEGVEDPEQLLANPKNYRIHPRSQQAQMEAIFDKVGIVQRVIVNRTTGHLVDGHMRVQMAMGRIPEIPVVYVELTPEEEDLVLATLDPIGDLAASDREQLAALLDDVGQVEGLDELLAGLAEDALPSEPDEPGRSPSRARQRRRRPPRVLPDHVPGRADAGACPGSHGQDDAGGCADRPGRARSGLAWCESSNQGRLMPTGASSPKPSRIEARTRALTGAPAQDESERPWHRPPSASATTARKPCGTRSPTSRPQHVQGDDRVA